MSSGPWTLATRARHTRVEPQAERAREDAIRDMAASYYPARQMQITPEQAAWRVQGWRETAHERQWGIPPWSTERRLGPGRPIHWDGPHTGEGGWLTVAQAEAQRAKDKAAAQADAGAAVQAEQEAARQAAEAERQARQAAYAADRQARRAAARQTPPPRPDAFALTIHRVTAWDGPPVQPSVPYRCPRCPQTVTFLEAVLPGIYHWRCQRCQAAVQGAVG